MYNTSSIFICFYFLFSILYMQSLFGKKQQQSEGKSIKKYLSESLIGPVSQAGNMTQDQKSIFI